MTRKLNWGVPILVALAGLACVACTPTATVSGAAEAGQNQGAGKPVQLRWSLKSAPRVYGYLVMRADNEAGPFLRLNERIILAKPVESGDAGHEYVDADVVSGKTYYYMLEAVSNNGSKSRLGDVIRRKVD
jgi:hypothetical protein